LIDNWPFFQMLLQVTPDRPTHQQNYTVYVWCRLTVVKWVAINRQVYIVLQYNGHMDQLLIQLTTRKSARRDDELTFPL